MRVQFTLHRFRLQLVGYRSWSASHDDGVISIDHVRQGVGLAQEELESRVFDATLSELSQADIEFLLAMSQDEGKTLQANLKARLAKSPSQVSIYKKRLLEAGVIDEPVRGKLVFALPGFKDYLIKTMGKPRFAQLPLPNNSRTEQVARNASAGAGSASFAITFGAL